MFERKEKKKPISARIRESLKDHIEQVAEKEGIYPSEVVEAWLLIGKKEYSKQYPGDANALQSDSERNAKHKTINNKQETNIRAKASRFVPPSLDEVTQYFFEKQVTNYIDESEKFFNFYESKNWMVGKNKMQKWKSAASGWIKRNETNQQKSDGKKSFLELMQSDELDMNNNPKRLNW